MQPTNLTSSIQVSEEAITAGANLIRMFDERHAIEPGEDAEWAKRIYLAMRTKELLAQGGEVERASRVFDNLWPLLHDRISLDEWESISNTIRAALGKLPMPIGDEVREALNGAFSAGWLTRHERPDAQPQDAFEIYWASKDEERHG